MILAKVSNSESYKKEAVEAIEKYDNEGMIGQVQIGRSIIFWKFKISKRNESYEWSNNKSINWNWISRTYN